MTRGASVPEATSTPVAGMARSASATLAGCSPPASVTGTWRATAAAMLRLHAHAGATRVPAAGGVEQDPLGAGLELRTGARPIDDVRVVVRPHLERLPDGPSELRDGRDRLVAAQLDGVGVDGGDDAPQGLRTAGRR